ncbi:MAG: methionine ABC transporter substrate-binding protein, partial [Syntrophaceticus sp.]|nr:methionine ABC transporter substrate-binding protein [Syntrophaceticus sp.]
MKKRALALICCFALLIGLAAGCGNGDTNGDAESAKLVVGATAQPHAEILEVVKPMLEEEGI